MLTEGCFGDRDAMTRAGDLGRQARVEVRRKRVKRADTLYAKALRAHPLHHGLWLEWAVFGKQQEMSVAWWRRFHAALLEGLVEHQDIAWSVLTKHVYPALRPHLQPTEQANLFFKFIDSQTGWGRGRWPAEGAWNWLRTQLPKKQQGAFVRRISKRMTPTKEFGSLAVSWVLGLHPKPGPARESALEMLVKDIGKDTKASKSQMIHLAKLVVPRAAADGDSALFQSFGRTVAHLSKKVPIAGVKPFSGQLLSDGGTLLVSGGGNRYDRPVGHWGVLRPGGGYSHTSKGPCSIAVRLECQAKLRGVIVQNVPGLKQSRAEGARVEISDDGKVWRPIATLEGNRPVYKIDFKEKDHNCLWVRIAKDTEYLHFSHFLVYGRRRS
jgi:hypothetical protein